MWIMAPYGVVMPAAIGPRDRKRRTLRAYDVQLRARDKRALVHVRTRLVAGGWPVSRIEGTPTRDYEYRCYATREGYAAILAEEVKQIAYVKFKPEADRVGGPDLYDLYSEIWYVVARHYDSAILRSRGEREPAAA